MRLRRHKFPDVVATPWIKRRKRFVQQHCLGICQQGAHQRRPRALPARQRGRVARAHPVQPGLRQRIGRRHAPCHTAPDGGRQAERKVVGHRQMREQNRLLEHDADATRLGRQVRHVAAVQKNPPCHVKTRRQMTSDRVQKRRFSRSGRACDRGHLARDDGQIQPREQRRTIRCPHRQSAQLQAQLASPFRARRLRWITAGNIRAAR